MSLSEKTLSFEDLMNVSGGSGTEGFVPAATLKQYIDYLVGAGRLSELDDIQSVADVEPKMQAILLMPFATITDSEAQSALDYLNSVRAANTKA